MLLGTIIIFIWFFEELLYYFIFFIICLPVSIVTNVLIKEISILFTVDFVFT
jgi:hypothetical protein